MKYLNDLATALGYTLIIMPVKSGTHVNVMHGEYVAYQALSTCDATAFLLGVRYQQVENKRALSEPLASTGKAPMQHMIDGALCPVCSMSDYIDKVHDVAPPDHPIRDMLMSYPMTARAVCAICHHFANSDNCLCSLDTNNKDRA